MTPEEYKTLFEKYGVIPATGTYEHSDDTGKCAACSIGILFRERIGPWSKMRRYRQNDVYQTMVMQLANETGASLEFLKGVDDGWEGPERRSHFWSTDYQAGFNEGRAAAELLKPDHYAYVLDLS
jgi:hypothetical protein